VALPLIVGATTLPLADYRALTCGDVVRVESTPFDVTGRAIVRFAGRRLHLCWLDAQRCFEVQAMSDDSPFPDPAIDDTAAGATSSIQLSAIPVRLSFSLGVLSLTVGDISEIGMGSLLPLDRGVPPQVKIEANGLPIGAGELVDLDGKLAVEITEWPHDGAAPPTS
jgi:type III secretion protein Q